MDILGNVSQVFSSFPNCFSKRSNDFVRNYNEF